MLTLAKAAAGLAALAAIGAASTVAAYVHVLKTIDQSDTPWL